MKDPRAKRRRESVDDEGDTEMHDTPRQSRQRIKNETPTRSSGRQRKPVQRFDAVSGVDEKGDGDGDGDGGEDEDEDEDEEDYRDKPPRRAVRFTAKEEGPVEGPEEDEEEDEVESEEDDLDLAALLQQNIQESEEKDLDVAALLQQNIQESEEIEPLPEYAEELHRIRQNEDKAIRTITQTVLEKITGKRRVPLVGLDSEYHKVHHLLSQTVTAGEGNSMLLLGSRGSGKTAILETALSDLEAQHANEFHVVRLNGFLHTDDRLALREMWRQLGREMNTEEEAGKVNSYADTMATLLALLSHPEELFGPMASDDTRMVARSVVIVLDEFDLFVSHARQTLLYNLFDIAQARKAPVAVIGLTTRVDVTEMLEKRVKSRFSHRYVYVPLARSFDMFSEVCFAGLAVDDSFQLADHWRRYLQGLWNDAQFRTHLLRIYHSTKSVPEFYTSAQLAMSELHHGQAIPTAQTFRQDVGCPDPAPLPFHASNSSLPLSLLLAATRLTALYDPGTGNEPAPLALALSFPAAYSEYVRLLTSAKTSASVSGARATAGRIWGREVAREAWEKLVGWGLVTAVGSGGSGTADGRMFRVEVSFEEVVAMAGSGGGLGRWWRD